MRDLQNIIHNCFEDDGHTRRYNSYTIPDSNSKSAYLVIPIKESFEIPAFALKGLKPDIDYIAINLQDINVRTCYKSLDSSVRDILTVDFPNNRLMKLPTKTGEPTYYGTYGAIFEENFNPVMMVLWEMERFQVEEENYPYDFKYKFVKPILRVSPEVFINRGNSVERYIINKILSSAVQNYNTYSPYSHEKFIDNTDHYDGFQMRVEIGGFQSMFLRRPDVPSISTTNEKLLKVVLDNIEETWQ